MKSTNIIIATLFAFQVSFLFAANAGEPANVEITGSSIGRISVAPTTPAEATFEEVFSVDNNTLMFAAPAVPIEADFNDNVPDGGIILKNLAPVTPVEADFPDSTEVLPARFTLAPSTPVEADFE
jgi:hypothetical protein